MTERRYPLWFYPNLWSLDAPLVAIAWMFMLGKAWQQQHLQWTTFFSLGACVWCIYAVDRLGDSFISKKQNVNLRERHLYHEKHRKYFLFVLLLILGALLYLFLFSLPKDILNVSIPAIVVSIAYFLVALTRKNDETPIIKNTLAGVAFAFGVAAATSVYLPLGGVLELLRSPEVLFFAVLCILNINAIDVWEYSAKSKEQEKKLAAELSLTMPLALLAGAGIFMAYWANEFTRPYYYSIVFSSAALQIINRLRNKFSLEALRVLADLALLLPVPLFFAI